MGFVLDACCDAIFPGAVAVVARAGIAVSDVFSLFYLVEERSF